MTLKQAKFIRIYAYSDNLQEAAETAGISVASAEKLLQEHYVQRILYAKREAIADLEMLEPLDVLKDWIDIVRADPRELTQVQIVNCRYCHGTSHHYQWTLPEWAMACERAMKQGNSMPEATGGVDFNANSPPHHNCPECGGRGETHAVFTSTDKLSSEGLKLFQAVKQTRNGLEIIMADKERARENIAKYLGMFVQKSEISGPNGGAIPVSASDMTDDQLALIVAAATHKHVDA